VCERLSRLRVLWADPTLGGLWLSYLLFRFGLPDPSQRTNSPGIECLRSQSKCSRPFSRHMPRSMVDPGRPSENSPNRSPCVGFWTVNTIAICIRMVFTITQITGLFHLCLRHRCRQAAGSAVFPVTYVVPSVRFNYIVRLPPPLQPQHSV
jgi:hypothetical protein